MGEAYKTAERHNLLPTPSPEPRFHLLISLINHSPSSYPHQRIWFLPSSGSRGFAGRSPLLWPHHRLDTSLAAGLTLMGSAVRGFLPLLLSPFLLSPKWGSPNSFVQPRYLSLVAGGRR